MQVSPWVALGLACLLAGCGGGGGGGGGGGDGTSPPPAAVDTTPEVFSFSGQSGTARSTGVASNDIVISGITGNAPISITGGEYSINGGAFTSAPGIVANNQTVRVRATSPAEFSTTATVVLTVGGVSASFTVTTAAPDTTPDAFQFQSSVNAARGAPATSDSVTIASIEAPVPVSIENGEYSIDGGAFTSTAGSIRAGQAIRVRATSSTDFSATVTAVLTVGSVSASFAVTTLAADTTPDAFRFQRVVNATRGAQVTSNSVTISSIEVPVPVSIENGEYSIDGGSFTSTAGSIRAGQSLVVRARASMTYSKASVARVTVGPVAASFEVLSELPNYIPDNVIFDGEDIVYLLNNSNRLVFRWSLAEERYLDAYVVGSNNATPTAMAYSSNHQRLYLGYSTGEIRYIDVTASDGAEVAFANLTTGVGGLADAGNYILTDSASYYSSLRQVFDRSGNVTDQESWYYFSRTYAWDPVNSRLYMFRDGLSPNDLHYAVIDQSTGQIASSSESPYHGSYAIEGPIRVSQNGQYVLLGSGDIYNQSGLTWSGSLGGQVADARWFADGSLATLSTTGNQTTLRHRAGTTNLATLEQLTYTGQGLRIVGSDTKMAVLAIANNTVRFHIYTPSTDSDGDGVANTDDAFPLDPAASVDTDRDGYPDAWNSGRGPTDSTTGLSLDAYPQDSACYLAAHGNGTSCNYGATIPNYVPDQVVQNGDTVYLLSTANRRVYRWSIANGAYLNPYVVGIDQGFNTVGPKRIAYSSSHQRLYLGYETGAIQYIDVTSGAAEVPFTATAMALQGLVAVGNYVLAQDYSGAWATHYIFDRDGVVTDQADWNYYGADYAWDPVSSRVYFTRDSYSLRYETIDQTTGQITSQGESPYYSSYSILPPVRVSAGGDRILVGSGDLFSGSGLTRSGSIGGQIADARWFANGTLVTLTAGTNRTTLSRRGANLATLEQLTYTGTPVRVVGSDTRMAVLTLDSGTVRFHIYAPTDDNDGDGVTNTQDAFPLDPAASIDTDRDGYPDSWNPGRGASDSTTGLSLDAYPQDSACYLSSHGTGASCNYSATVPNYVPDQVVQNGDTVYLLSIANRRVYRWSLATASYMNPYVVGSDPYSSASAPTKMTYSSAHQRLYLGYSSGAIQYIDLASSGIAEVTFANTARPVNGLIAVGNYVLAQDDSGAWESHYVYDRNGVETDYRDWNYYSTEYAWDASSSRVYFFRNSSPGDLHYEVIDQTTGEITSSGETPYHGDYNIQGPIRVSSGGQYVLLGSGDIYNRTGLTWARSLGTQVTDARWFADDSLATLRTANNQTTLRRVGTNLTTLEQLTFTGTALRIVGSDTRMAVLVNNNGTVQFHIYEPSDDSDGDGVTNTQDAFPLDPAASVDTDRDGYPDSWNAGSGPGDSTTGLSLDAYPQDAACYLASHGDGVNCDYGATLPNYVPDQVLNVGDTVYLLSSANRRVYRWSIATRSYLNPYVVGIDEGFNALAPTKMAYSSSHERLYLGYSSGAIQYIDVSSGNGAEVPLTNIAMSVGGLVAVGNYVLAQDRSGAWATHYIIDSNGVITDQETWNRYSREYAWDPVSSRVYFLRDDTSPNDLHYEVIDQATGLITDDGESPYHGDYGVQPPLRVSPDGEQILLGTGDVYARADLTREASLGKAIKDAHWTDRVLVDVDTTDRVEIRDLHTRAVLTSTQYLGQPLRLVFGQTDAYLVHVMNNTTAFVRLAFGDQDSDSLPQWWEQLYGLSDSNAADALGDIDGDGVSNEDEYLNRSNPEVVDTDADGLTDQQEIVTYSTDPWRADSDGDGLDDEAEVLTHQSDPRDTDSDDDGYTDFDEVLYGGNPNDETVVPQPLLNYTQSFENNPDLSAWSMPSHSNAAWDIDSTVANTGAASLKSGSVAHGQNSSIRFRGFFSAGELSFYARLDSQYCCNQLQVLVDGVQVRGTYNSTMPWTRYTLPITLGVHTIEWRFVRDAYSGPSTDSAHIDDVVFVGQ
jgi:hypothetical protein